MRCRKKKSLGSIAIEVSLTLPVVLYMIFFCIELVKINITQDALQTICEEATYLTIAHNYDSGADLIKQVDEIIEKYRPSFIPKTAPGYMTASQPVIRWCYETYSSLDEMLKNTPYGGSCICYPNYEIHHDARVHGSFGYSPGNTEYIPVLNMEWTSNPENYADTVSFMTGSGLPSNRIFVLNIVCNYPFSNSFVKLLFNGGVNTKKNSGHGGHSSSSSSHLPGTMYLLYARGAGIVNEK